MAVKVFTNAHVTVNGVNLSSAVREARLELRNEHQDVSAMGDTYRNRVAGINDWTLTLQMYQDRATGIVDGTLFGLNTIGSNVAVQIFPSGNSVSVENPEYSGPVVLENYGPMQAVWGAIETCQATLIGAGTLNKRTA